MSVQAPAQAQPVPVALPVVHSELVRRQTRLAWWLLLPSLLVVALVALVPLAQTFLAELHQRTIGQQSTGSIRRAQELRRPAD